MADFDIEAYLEQQVGKDSTQIGSDISPENKDKNRRDGKDSDTVSERGRDSRRERGSSRRRSRSGPRRRRTPSRERRHRRSSSRDRRSDRDRRAGSRDRSKERSNDRSERTRKEKDNGDKRGPDQNKNKDIPVPVVEVDPYQQQLELQTKRREEERKRTELRRQQEVEDLTKDQRTVFIGQLTMKVTEENLREFFSQIGVVKSSFLIRDKNSGKHKGFGYVEMQDMSSIPSCLLFNNVVPDFQKYPILVKASEAEKNFIARKEPVKSSMPEILDNRIYVGNLHVNIDEDSLRILVEQFGPVDSIHLHRDDMGNSKGFAFVKYRSHDNAQMAMTGLSGMELVGRPLKVGPVLDQNNYAKVSNHYQAEVSSASTSNWKLDDDDGSKGFTMNSQNRQMLMAKLGAAAGIQVPVATSLAVTSGPMVPASSSSAIAGIPSRAFLISNMFDLESETDSNWDEDIKEDVLLECRKFGQVEKLYVEKRKPGGLVFVKFTTTDASCRAAQSLHGRFFAGKVITATYLEPQVFDSMIA